MARSRGLGDVYKRQLVVWRTQLHMLWLIGLGALLGALGWV
jgi:hypothetical protein